LKAGTASASTSLAPLRKRQSGRCLIQAAALGASALLFSANAHSDTTPETISTGAASAPAVDATAAAKAVSATNASPGATAAANSKAASIAAGKRVFARCASCHQIGGSAGAAFGPQLTGIVGRRAAATSDFAYSAAMKASRLVWTEQNLAAFIRDPKSVVPGTSMRFWGLGDERQIADLLAYLKSVK
jgi:cytochrome c